MKSTTNPVIFKSQTWKDFKTPPHIEHDGYGPSGMDLFIYYPKNKRIACWTNWSGSSIDIKSLKKEKALWCYKLYPLNPGEFG